MARYTGPATKKSRAFGEAIFGEDKSFEKRKGVPPGQHGNTRRRKNRSDYAIQLMEKQKAKYTYGVLERQFRKTFEDATKAHGVTGQVLLQLLEQRLDNVVYRLGVSRTRRAARQLVGHRHITVNGVVTNIPSFRVRPGDVIAIRGRSQNMEHVSNGTAHGTRSRFPWLDWNADKKEGIFIAVPNRDQIPEKINEQFIVELYSK
jgi:small subunit ribosomal protein S4